MFCNRLVFSLILFSIALGSSCTKTAEGIPGPAGPVGETGKSVTDQRSAITGYVQLISQFTVIDTQLSGVKVSTVMGDSALSVLTDNNGKFLLPALKSGTYRIMFSRNGYDSIALNREHSAGNEDQFLGIMRVAGTSTTKITNQTNQLLQSPFDLVSKYLNITTTISGPVIRQTNMRYIELYFSNSPRLNARDYLFMTETYTHGEGTNQFDEQVYFQGTEINSTRFKAGDTVYMKTYIVPPYSLRTSWFDTNTYQTLAYPYVGDSSLNYFIWSN